MNLTANNRSGRKKRVSPSKSYLWFFMGFFMGFFLFITIAAIHLHAEGINVYLKGEKILSILSKEIEKQVQKEFPHFIGKVRSEVPFLVEQYMQDDFISIGNLEIGGYLVKLPDQFIEELEKNLRNDVVYYVLELLDELEDEQFVRELCQSITDDIMSSLVKNGQVITIPLTKRYSIPVVLWLSSTPLE